MALLQINYPDSFRGKSDDMIVATIKLWASVFKDEPYKAVENAIYAYMATDTGRFMPTVGLIKDALHKWSTPDAMTEGEAWQLVAKALRNGTYGAEEEFAALPPSVQRAVGSPNQLREWAKMDVETVQSVVASNFQRSFRVRQQRDDEFQKLPGEIRKFIQQAADSVAMPMLTE